MNDIVLKNLDEALLERIDRIARRSGWDRPTTLMHLLEQGLDVSEGHVVPRLESGEADVLQAAFAALNDVPDDPGFAMIGKVPASQPEP